MTGVEILEDTLWRRRVIPEIIMDADSGTSPYYPGMGDVKFLCDEFEIGYFGHEARYGNITVRGINEGFVTLGVPCIFTATGSTTSILHCSEFVAIPPDQIIFVSSTVVAPELAEGSSLDESRSPLVSDEHIGIGESFEALESLTQQMNRLVPLSRSSALIDLARQAVAAMSERSGEDVEEWARKLANDVKDAAD